MKRMFWSGPAGTGAAGLLVAIAAAGAAAIVFAGGGSRVTTLTARSVRPVVRVSSTGCSLPAGSQDATAIALSPPAATFAQVGNIMVPQAPTTLGPQHTTADGYPYCFADSPGGALLAAINVWAIATAHTSTQLVQHYAINPPRSAFGKTTWAGYPLTFAGYHLLTFSASRAVVEVVLGVANQGNVQETTPMVWDTKVGDWRLYIPPSGGLATSIVDPSMEGSAFVGWSAP